MVKVNEYPEEGEFVVGTVKTVKDYGAFVTLDEYPEKEGFVHIADVSSGWIKYIRDHVWEGQKVVCKVTKVKPEMGHIDLSLKSVNDHQKRLKIQEWKNEFKGENLLKLVAERTGSDYDTALKEYGHDLVREFDTLHNAFVEASATPDEFVRAHKGEWVDMFSEIARENISPPQVTIDGVLAMNILKPDGVEIIREALKAVEDAIEDDELEISVSYVGAPRYRIQVRAPDYKTAEEAIKRAADVGVDMILAKEGEASFTRKG
jgi:translation initiation factor 2 subunit 1